LSQSLQRRRNVVSSTIGNVLEWYDFAVYGALASTIGTLFFPSGDALASLLASFTVFAVGYAARPLGGILLGHIGDRYGRKPALILSISVMGFASLLVGLLPTHAQIGQAAAICMVLLRIVQGLSVGGEYPASIVFLAEHAPDRNRGLYTSWPMLGSVLGFLLGVGSAAVLNTWLGDSGVEAWGWRLLFFLGASIAVFGAFFRSRMSEPAASGRGRQDETMPIVIAFRDHWRAILRIMALTLVNAVGFYLLWAYSTSYLTERMHVSTAAALDINTISLAALAVMVPLAAMAADRIGRKPLLYFVSLGSLVLALPLWWIMHHQNPVLILLAQTGFALLYASGYAGLSAVMAEILPARIRCSAACIGYNLCMAAFGGTTPLVATYLIARTSDDYMPAYYLMAAACLSLIAVFGLKETAGKPLQD
jgi:MHS family proline/betaine transporter-like MFS transporter